MMAAAEQGPQTQVPLGSVTPTNEDRGCVAFKDVAVSFSEEEWLLLDDSQRLLYRRTMIEIFIIIASLGLVPSEMHDITRLEPSGDPFTPALRFVTSGGQNREETSPVEQGTPAEGGMNAAMPERQKQVCGEEPLQRKQVRILAVKTSRSDLPEKMAQSTDSVMDFQDSPSLLGSQVTPSAGQPHRCSGNAESIHYQCSDCDKTFRHKFQLIRHQTTHTGERPFKCGQCGKNFRQNVHLIVHLRIHTGEKRFTCSECGKAFGHKSSLLHHLNAHNGKRPYTCSQCGKSYRNKFSLVCHYRIHTGEKPFECSVCGESYRNRVSLASHYRFHTGEKPYKCNQCGKSFREKSNLFYHGRVHNKERPFRCGECGKCFIQNCNLVKHQKVHSMPLVCNECGSVFTSNYNLIRHKRVHLTRKQYECKECGNSSGLYKHRKIHGR